MNHTEEKNDNASVLEKEFYSLLELANENFLKWREHNFILSSNQGESKETTSQKIEEQYNAARRQNKIIIKIIKAAIEKKEIKNTTEHPYHPDAKLSVISSKIKQLKQSITIEKSTLNKKKKTKKKKLKQNTDDDFLNNYFKTFFFSYHWVTILENEEIRKKINRQKSIFLQTNNNNKRKAEKKIDSSAPTQINIENQKNQPETPPAYPATNLDTSYATTNKPQNQIQHQSTGLETRQSSVSQELNDVQESETDSSSSPPINQPNKKTTTKKTDKTENQGHDQTKNSQVNQEIKQLYEVHQSETSSPSSPTINQENYTPSGIINTHQNQNQPQPINFETKRSENQEPEEKDNASLLKKRLLSLAQLSDEKASEWCLYYKNMCKQFTLNEDSNESKQIEAIISNSKELATSISIRKIEEATKATLKNKIQNPYNTEAQLTTIIKEIEAKEEIFNSRNLEIKKDRKLKKSQNEFERIQNDLFLRACFIAKEFANYWIDILENNVEINKQINRQENTLSLESFSEAKETDLKIQWDRSSSSQTINQENDTPSGIINTHQNQNQPQPINFETKQSENQDPEKKDNASLLEEKFLSLVQLSYEKANEWVLYYRSLCKQFNLDEDSEEFKKMQAIESNSKKLATSITSRKIKEAMAEEKSLDFKIKHPYSADADIMIITEEIKLKEGSLSSRSVLEIKENEKFNLNQKGKKFKNIQNDPLLKFCFITRYFAEHWINILKDNPEARNRINQVENLEIKMQQDISPSSSPADQENNTPIGVNTHQNQNQHQSINLQTKQSGHQASNRVGTQQNEISSPPSSSTSQHNDDTFTTDTNTPQNQTHLQSINLQTKQAEHQELNEVRKSEIISRSNSPIREEGLNEITKDEKKTENETQDIIIPESPNIYKPKQTNKQKINLIKLSGRLLVLITISGTLILTLNKNLQSLIITAIPNTPWILPAVIGTLLLLIGVIGIYLASGKTDSKKSRTDQIPEPRKPTHPSNNIELKETVTNITRINRETDSTTDNNHDNPRIISSP